ncbi:hypothetical protein PybrP1_009645 [[Pythium] brassicae (nom. inval.)]|nr:hypothetical protein PybrP1_009645 [[Pythium] brassicae (nom. inval.)]
MYTAQPGCDLCADTRELEHATDARRSLLSGSARDSRAERTPPVTLAAMQGRLDHVRHWVEHAHCDVDSLDFVGTTPLQRAALEGHADTVRYLVQRGAALQTRVLDTKDTVLHLAAAKGHAEVVRLLLGGGAHLEARNADNLTPLLAAVRANHERVVHVLVANGASPSALCAVDGGDEGSALHLAAQYGHLALVHFLLGVVALDVNERTRRGRATPLHVAARHGHAEFVRFLTARHRADVRARDARGMTALHYTCDYAYHLELPLAQHDAVERRHVEVATALLAAGAEVKARRRRDRATPLRCAAVRGHLRVAKALLERGARGTAATRWLFALFWWAREPLKVKFLLSGGTRSCRRAAAAGVGDDMVAAEKDERPACRDSLSSCGTQVESPTATAPLGPSRRASSSSSLRRRGRSELHAACVDCDVVALSELLDPTHVDDALLEARTHPDGLTALHLAAQSGWIRGLVALLEAGAHVDAAATASGATPLHFAAERGHLAALKQLVAHGASADACDHAGATPLVVAVRSGRSRALKLLLRHGSAATRSLSQSGRDNRSSYVDLGALASRSEAAVASRHEEHLRAFDPARTTALHLAAFLGSLERVRQLVWDGEDVDARDQDGATPVWLAALMGHLDVVAFLAEQGANLDAVANNGASVALGAAEFGHLEVLAFLTGDATPELDGQRLSLTRLSLQDHASETRLSSA